MFRSFQHSSSTPRLNRKHRSTWASPLCSLVDQDGDHFNASVHLQHFEKEIHTFNKETDN